MNNIFIEGISGTGKSTLLMSLRKLSYILYFEGDLNPIDLTRCAYLTEIEYKYICHKYCDILADIKKNTLSQDNYNIIAYTKIITDIEGFHKDLEKYEIYHGNISLENFKSIILKRFSNFSDYGNIFECSFFQNILTTLILFYELPDDEIINFYGEIYEQIKNKNFKLIYIKSSNIKETILTTKHVRTYVKNNHWWYDLLVKYINNSPFAVSQNKKDFDLLEAFFIKRTKLELTIINRLNITNILFLSEKNFKIDEIKDFCLD